jgi:AcrR family transcriptional regulator
MGMVVRRLTPEQVFVAAERIVDEHGWDGLTIAALAADLGVRGPSLYTHVAGLDAIRSGLQARTMAAMSLVLRDAAMGRSGGDAMRAMCAAFRAFALAHPNRYMAMTQAPVDPTVFIEASVGADAATRAALRAFDLDEAEVSSVQFGLYATAHGFVSLEIAGVFTSGLDPAGTEALYREAIDRVVAALEHRHANQP